MLSAGSVGSTNYRYFVRNNILDRVREKQEQERDTGETTLNKNKLKSIHICESITSCSFWFVVGGTLGDMWTKCKHNCVNMRECERVSVPWLTQIWRALRSVALFIAQAKREQRTKFCLFIRWRIQLAWMFCVILLLKQQLNCFGAFNLPSCGNYPENKHLLNIHLIHFRVKTHLYYMEIESAFIKNAAQMCTTHSNRQWYFDKDFLILLFGAECWSADCAANGISLNDLVIQWKIEYALFAIDLTFFCY